MRQAVRHFHFTLYISSVFLSLFNQSSTAVESSQLLAVLKAKDEQIDNVQLFYTVSGEQQLKPDWKASLYDEEVLSAVPVPALPLPVLYHEEMIVRGEDTTFIRRLDPGLQSTTLGPTKQFMCAYQKWSNASGMAREISTPMLGPLAKPEDTIVEIAPINAHFDPIALQRGQIELALGFGLGKRITQITSLQENKDGYQIEGRINFFGVTNAHCEAIIDRDYIVRYAKVVVEIGYVSDSFEWHTAGSVETDLGIIAETGEYRTEKRSTGGAGEIGELLREREFSVNFSPIVASLSDAVYVSLIAIEPPVGATVFDRIAGTQGIAGQPAIAPSKIEE